MAVYELLLVTPGLRGLVRDGASDDDLQALAIKGGMTPLTSRALALARSGETSLAEVLRARLD